jgi:Protein of unknown function (DUF1573)
VKLIYVISAAISLFIPLVAQAELKWEQTSLELNPTFSEKQAVGHFKYQNTGDQPVRFKSVKASCGCTTAQTQKEQVAPGEKGEITATFNIGDRTGQQVKQVTVETDDPAHPVTVLTLKTNIPQLLELQPNFVFWQTGDESKPKTVVAKAGKDVPITDLEVRSTSPQFDVKVDKGPAAGQFKINIQPKQTAGPAFATLTVKPDFPKDSPKTFYISARVSGPVPAAAAPKQPAAGTSSSPVAAASPGQ